MSRQVPQTDPAVLHGTAERGVHGAVVQPAAPVTAPTASPDQPISGLPSVLIPGSYAVSNHPHGTLPLSQGTSSPSPLKLSLLTLTKSPNSRQTQSSQAHPGSKSPTGRTPLGDKSNTPPQPPAATASAGAEAETKAAASASQGQQIAPGQPSSQNAGEGPIDDAQQGCLDMADQEARGTSVQLPMLAALPGQGSSQRQLDTASKQPPQGLQDNLPASGGPGGADLGPACPPTQLVLLPATQVVAPTQAVLPGADEAGDGLPQGEEQRLPTCPHAGPTLQPLVPCHAADCTPSKVQQQETLEAAPVTSLPAAGPSLLEAPLARATHEKDALGPQHPPSSSPGRAGTEAKGREIQEQEASLQLDKAAPAAESSPAATSDPDAVAGPLHATGVHPAVPAAHAGELLAQLPQPSACPERAENAVAGHCQAQQLQQQQQQQQQPQPATSRRLAAEDALGVAEAEQRLRQLMCGEGATPMTLGSDATACTDGSGWTETEAVTQYQSLLGEDAAAQEAISEHARALAAGEATGALKSLVANELVLDIGRAFLGRDFKRMRASFINTCLRILWRELRRHGLDGFCFEGGEPEEAGERLMLDPEEEAEVEGFLCSEAEVERRRQQLATRHLLSRASVLRRPSSAGTATMATEGSPPSGQVQRTAQHSTPGSVKPRAAAQVLPGGAEREALQQGQQHQPTLELGSLGATRTRLQVPSKAALVTTEVLAAAADAQPRMAAAAAAAAPPPAALPEAAGRPSEALEDAGAAELDIHPTLVSPPRPPHIPRLQPADGPSQLDIPPTQPTGQPAQVGSPRPIPPGKPCLAASTAAVAVTQASPSQLDVPCTLLTAPPQPSAGQALLEPTLAASGPGGAPPATAQAAVGQAGTTQAVGDPFDDLFASQPLSEPSLLPKTKAQVQFAGSWWFGTSTAQEPGRCTLQMNAAAQPAATAVQRAAAGGPGQEQPGGQGPQQAQHQQQAGIICSMVPDTPPEAPSSAAKPPQRQDGLGGKSSPAGPPDCSPAAPAVPAGEATAVEAAAGRAAERQQVLLGPAGPMPVPDSEDPTACGAQAAQQQCASAKGAAGFATQDPAGSQAVGEADLRRALDAVGRISDDFPATQEVMGAAAAPAARHPLSLEPVASRQQVAAGSMMPPVLQQGSEEGPRGGVEVERTAAAQPLAGPAKRRWKQGQAQQGEASEPSGAEDSPRLVGVARRGDRKSSGRGAKAAQGEKSKQQARREQRQGQRAKQMAPLGIPRPDLAASGGLIFVHKSPGVATARRLSAGAAGGVLPLVSRSPEVAAPASEQPAPQVWRASNGDARTGQAAAGRSAQAAAGLHSSGLQDGDLFATQLHFLHPGAMPALHERDGGAAAPAVGQSAASPSLYNAGRGDPFSFPSDGQSGGRAAPVQRQPGSVAAVRAITGGVTAGNRKTASLNELAKTAPSVPEPEPEAEEPEEGDAAEACGRARQGQPQREQQAQEESEEQQLLIIHGPHPLVQTMPQGEGADAAWMQRKLAAAGAQQLGKQQQQEGQAVGNRPTRQIKPLARFRDSPQKAEDPAATGAAGGEPPQLQREETGDGGQQNGQATGRKRSTAPADGLATVSKRRRSSVPHAVDDGGRTPAAVIAGAAGGSATAVPNVAAAPASEDQLLAQYMASYKLGCSKCRHSSNGCGKCRADRDSIIQSAIQAGLSVLPPAPQGSPSPSRRKSTSAAAAAAGALLSASPSPRLAGKRQHREELAVEAAAAAQPEAEQGRRRLSGRQRREDLPSCAGGAAGADNEEPPLSQDMGGRQKRAKGSNAAAGKGQQGVGGQQGEGAEASPAGMRRQRVFEGARFLVTGFSDCPDRKRELVGLITKHGGTLLADVPRPGPQGRRHSMGGRGEGISFVLCDNKLRTPKFLYAVIRGTPIVKPCWVESCVAAGSQVPPRAQHLAYATGPAQGGGAEERPPAFAGVRVYLHGARSITDSFGQLLQHAGAVIVSCIEAAVPAAGRAGRLPAQTEAACDLLLLDADEEGEAGARGTISSLQRLARRLHIPIHDREWAIRVLLEGQLPDDFPLMQQQRRQQLLQQLEQGEAGTPTLRGRKPAASPVPGASALPAGEEPPRGRSNQGPRSLRKPIGSREGGREQQQQQEQQPSAEQEANAARAGPATAQLALHVRSASGEVHASSPQWRGRPSAGRRHSSTELAVLQQATAGRQPSLQPGNTPPAQPLQAPPPQQYQEQQRLQHQFPQQQHTPQQQHQQLPASLAWLGAPQPAPPDLPNTSVRQYYAAFVKDGVEVRLGDCVELAPAPGEEMPRLALIQALWAEPAPDGRERMLARCRRFYRPQETTRKILRRSLPHEVYLSDHVEDRVLLAAVLGRCVVLAEEPDQLQPNTYVCEFKYDCNTTALLPLDNGQEWRCC